MKAIAFDRDEVECTCSRAFTAASWYVASPHRTQVGVSLDWAPYGLRHARQIGSTWTACGLPAVNWFIFHALSFVPGAAGTCLECASAIGESNARHQRERETPSAATRERC